MSLYTDIDIYRMIMIIYTPWTWDPMDLDHASLCRKKAENQFLSLSLSLSPQIIRQSDDCCGIILRKDNKKGVVKFCLPLCPLFFSWVVRATEACLQMGCVGNSEGEPGWHGHPNHSGPGWPHLGFHMAHHFKMNLHNDSF